MSIREFSEDWKKSHAVTGTFEVTAQNIAGTETCQVELPGRYAGKRITVVVYESRDAT